MLRFICSAQTASPGQLPAMNEAGFLEGTAAGICLEHFAATK